MLNMLPCLDICQCRARRDLFFWFGVRVDSGCLRCVTSGSPSATHHTPMKSTQQTNRNCTNKHPFFVSFSNVSLASNLTYYNCDCARACLLRSKPGEKKTETEQEKNTHFDSYTSESSVFFCLAPGLIAPKSPVRTETNAHKKEALCVMHPT